MIDEKLALTLDRITASYLELKLSDLAQREEINALASVVSTLSPELKRAFEQQLAAERKKNEGLRAQIEVETRSVREGATRRLSERPN